MKSFRKVVIASMLAVAPVVAAGMAWANTELVPGARLVAPYWDISGDRSTLMFLTNVSRRANLVKNPAILPASVCALGGITTSPTPGVGVTTNTCAVHLEFYDKTCDNIDLTIDLTKQDIDQLDLKVDTDLGGVRGLESSLGWLDVDVRRGLTADGHTNPGVQANVLVGTVVITDSGSDFAVAYPMASSIGSSNSGVGGDIVTRDGQGSAAVWSGGYESFPARVYVPMFFAEGTNYTETFSSTLVIAGPAQASIGAFLGTPGEAPGQDLNDDPNTGGVDESILIDAQVNVVDACENSQSDNVEDHYIFGTLDEILTQQVTAPYQISCDYPSNDNDRPGSTPTTAFQGGYLEITNHALSQECDDSITPGVSECLIGVAGERERGLVGVLVQNTTHTGDATRLWGDCSFPDGDVSVPDQPGNPLFGGCRGSFSLVDVVSHRDLLP